MLLGRSSLLPLQRKYPAAGVRPPCTRRARLLPPARFRSIDRPAEDPDLGARMAPAFDNTPLDLVAECQVRKFLGLASTRQLRSLQVATGVKGADASLVMLGTIIEVNDLKHAIVAVVVKQNTNANKLSELTLHWATAKHEGAQWIPPPAGCHHYPSNLMFGTPGGGAWRTPFALHVSPDGRPLHVALLQLPLEGVLSAGGISFVLNSGNQWMHNAHHGRDWYLQLSGKLPETTDLEGLPDPEVFPVSPQPASDEAQEAADRELMRAVAVQLKELEEHRAAAVGLFEAAARQAADDAAVAASAQKDADVVAKRLRMASEAIQSLTAGLEADKAAVAAAKVKAETLGQAAAAASAAAVEAAAVAAIASLDFDADLAVGGTSASSDMASKTEANASAANTAVADACAAVSAAEAAVAMRQVELSHAQEVLVSATKAHDEACARLKAAREVEARSAELARKQAAAKQAVCDGVAKEGAALEAARAEAAQRVWAQVEARQLLTIKRFLVELGPQPLKLSWLLSPSRSGRSLPVVPTAFNGVRNIQSADGDAGAWQRLVACSVQDLQLVMRSKLRKWLKVTPSQELHVIQYSCSTRLPDGSELPVMVWLTDGADGEPEQQDKAHVVVVIALDQSAAGSRSGRLQLHWGAALREGTAPAQPAGPGWRTSASHNWESSGCTLVTPFTVRRVPALGIGQRHARRPTSSAQGASAVSGDYCALAYASDSGVVGSAPALMPAPATTEVPEKQAHVVLLDLPLEGMLMTGGVTLSFQDAKGNHLHNAATGKPFFLELGLVMQQLAYMTAPRMYLPDEEEVEVERGEAEAEVAEAGEGADVGA